MSAPKFADSHNMVVFLAKPTKSEGFEQIVDFLNANPINIVTLTNNLYFNIDAVLATAKVKMFKWRKFQLQALNGWKKGIITEQLRKQRKDIEIPQSSGPTEPIVDEAVNEENVPTQSNDPPLSRVSTLGKIASLKKRVKKMERKRKSKTQGMKRLFKIGRSAQVVSSEDEGLGDQEDASKQGRKIDDIDQDVEVTLVDETHGRYDDAQMFDTDVFNGEEVFVAGQSEKVVEEVVSTAEVSVAATITTKEITLVFSIE
ncbi:hypothetical protein Tco_1311814 [Tanacetum coccineum]